MVSQVLGKRDLIKEFQVLGKKKKRDTNCICFLLLFNFFSGKRFFYYYHLILMFASSKNKYDCSSFLTSGAWHHTGGREVSILPI